jgi:hypothetical protein
MDSDTRKLLLQQGLGGLAFGRDFAVIDLGQTIRSLPLSASCFPYKLIIDLIALFGRDAGQGLRSF